MKKTNPLLILLLTYIVGLIVLFTVAICLSGCYTQHRAAKQFDHAVRQYPDIGYSWCANKFDDNVIPLYIPGDTVTLTDTVTVDCGDSVIIRSINKLVKVPVTTYKFRVDTFTRIIENKAELAAKQSEINNTAASYNQQLGKTKTWQIMAGICGGLALLAIVALVLIFRFK